MAGQAHRHEAVWQHPGPDGFAVLRPDAISFAHDERALVWRCEVIRRRFAGALLAFRVRAADGTELDLVSADRDVRVGDVVGIRIVREPVTIVAP